MSNDLNAHLSLDPNKPVVYVLQNKSFADLFVLERLVEQHNLPSFDAKSFNGYSGGESGFICLAIPSLWTPKMVKAERDVFNLVQQIADTGREVQILPVSIFWGRNPGKENAGLIRTLFFNRRKTGAWHKMFAILFNGRKTLANFGKPFFVKKFFDNGLDTMQTSRKVYRLLRIHFTRQLSSILGPELYDRESVISRIVRSEYVDAAIRDHMLKKGCTREKAEAEARKCVDEIASDLTFRAIYLFDKALKWLWQKVYRGVELKNEHYLHQVKNSDSIIYMPTHKSHMDYLLICYVLYHNGMMSPHTAAGINLNFWPVGGILRKGGAFFLRRSFKGNRLYAACFNEYLHFLVKSGFPINFFPEGGRSRSGRLLKPKTGMLSMIVQAQARIKHRNISLVPVYISYDKIVEGKSYENEKRGKKKKKESVGQLLGAYKLLRSKMGSAYVSFGQPIDLKEYLDEKIINWIDSDLSEEKPRWIGPAVNSLAGEMMSSTNACVIVSPVSVISLGLLAAPNRALTKESFESLWGVYCRWLTDYRYDDDTVVELNNFNDALNQARDLAGVDVLAHPTGDIIHISEKRSMRLSYYSNTITHLFALPSFISYMFVRKHRRDKEEILEAVKLIYPFLQKEFFLKWDPSALDEEVEKIINFMVSSEILESSDDGTCLVGPDVTDINYTNLKITGNILEAVFQYYAMGMILLIEAHKIGPISRDKYDKQLAYLIDRASLLSGDSIAYRTLSDYKFEFNSMMRFMGYYKLSEDGQLIVGQNLVEKESSLNGLIDKALRASTKRIARLLIDDEVVRDG